MTAAHPRDLSPEAYALAMASGERPELLQQLVETSRRIWGVYTSHFPHTINYPWIAAKLENLIDGARILDIGAGASPLPLFLAERGAYVDTVDPHWLIRTTAASPDWNEWGFFDYGVLHPRLTSHHCAVADLRPSRLFDAIYSVSVIAHLARSVREDAFRRCQNWLGPGGILLLAIDIIPSTDYLWNYSEGQEVEAPEEHGSIDDVTHQLAALGFRIDESRVVRNVPTSRTDLAFVHAIRE
jgi:SAM-dependent methyltransferase